MKKQTRIQSVKHLIELKTKRLNYTRIPYLREYLLQDIADLQQIEWLFFEKSKELKQLNDDYTQQANGINRLECVLKIFGLSDEEIFAYTILDINELKRLYILATQLGEYKIPQRFLITNNHKTNESEVQ